MSVLLIIVHVIVCIALIMIVLLQTGKGADMGAAFGGGSSQTLFGNTGASTFLSKATTVAAVVFMITSLTLAYLSTNTSGKSIMTHVQSPAAPVAAPASESTAAGNASQASPAAAAPSSPQAAPSTGGANTGTK